MDNATTIFTKISSILEIILDLGQFDSEKKFELLDQLKTSLITNIACSIIEEIPEQKQNKYNDIIIRISESKSSDQAKKQILIESFQSIIDQCSQTKLNEIFVTETTRMIEQLVAPIKDELDQSTLDSIKAQSESILAD